MKWWFAIRWKNAPEPELFGPFNSVEEAKEEQKKIWAAHQFGDDTYPVYAAENETKAKDHFHYKGLMK